MSILYSSAEEEGEVREEDPVISSAFPGAIYTHPLVSISHIDPDEIPDIPKNRFLYRAVPDQDDPRDPRRQAGARRRGAQGRVRAYTKSGRKVKGRGSLVSKIVKNLTIYR